MMGEMVMSFISDHNTIAPTDISVDTDNMFVALYTSNGYYELFYTGEVEFIYGDNGVGGGVEVSYYNTIALPPLHELILDVDAIAEYVVQQCWDELVEQCSHDTSQQNGG